MTKNEIEIGLAKIKKLFEELLALPPAFSAQELLQAHNELLLAIEAVSHPAGLMSHVHPDAEIRANAEWAEQRVAELVTEISLSRALYEIFMAADAAGLDEIPLRLLQKIKTDFVRSGVATDDTTRQRIKEIQEQLVEKGQAYSRNVREDVRAIHVSKKALEGMPADYGVAHPAEADGAIKITTDYPDFFPFMRYSVDADARRELFFAFHQRGYPQNIPLLREVLTLRHELAQLLGFSNWAAYSTADKMIQTESAARAFIADIATSSKERMEKERATLLKEKQKEFPDATELFEWEKGFYENKFKERAFTFDSQSVRPYFLYEAVEAGLLRIASQLYGITFQAEPTLPVWHESVRTFSVWRQNEKIGIIYLDMHPRDAKYKHAAQFPVQSGIAGVQIPIGALVCNIGTELIDHDQVVTMFHEFGHLMHHLLGGNVAWQYFSGVATEWDFVEAPSQLFEEWAWNTEVLHTFAQHHETAEPIPDALVARMRAAHEWGTGLFARRQMAFAAISLELHTAAPRDAASMEKTIAELTNEFGAFPSGEALHSGANFEHLIGYHALYYTYMWSLVIAKDLRAGFDAANLLNPSHAQRYAENILAPGGTQDARTLIENFLGRPYSFDAFRAWLAQDVN